MVADFALMVRSLVLGGFAFFALSLPATSVSAQSGSNTIRMASPVGFSTFDPFRAPAPGIDYLRPVYDTLVMKVGLDRYKPGLAESYSYDGVAKQFRMKLRKGVSFSDGQPFNAASVKANFEHGMAMKGSPWADVYGNFEKITTPAPDEVVLHLKSSDPTILESLHQMPGMMVSPVALANASVLATNPVGTGPWRFDSKRSILGERYTYVRTPGYWNPSVQQVQSYVLQQIPDAAARVNALRSGQVDVAFIQHEQIEALARLGFRIEATGALFQALQIADARGEVVPALGDLRVRKAIGLAIDRSAILKVLYKNRGAARTNFYPLGVQGHSVEVAKQPVYDPKRARLLLNEAGYVDGFSVDVAIQPQHARVASAVAGELAKVGIKLNITVMPDSGSWQAVYRQRKSPIGILGQHFVPPHRLWSYFAAANGRYNPFRLDWPTMNHIAQEAADVGVDERVKQDELYAALIKRVVDDDAILFPIVVVDLMVAIREGIVGAVTTHSGGGLPDPRVLSIRDTKLH